MRFSEYAPYKSIKRPIRKLPIVSYEVGVTTINLNHEALRVEVGKCR